MERSGPGITRDAVGPLHRLATGRDRRPARTTKPLVRYGAPIVFLALAGLGIAAARYLIENRGFDQYVTGLLGAGSVLPVMLAFRRPLVAVATPGVPVHVAVGLRGRLLNGSSPDDLTEVIAVRDSDPPSRGRAARQRV
jgi:hypothetical protein